MRSESGERNSLVELTDEQCRTALAALEEAGGSARAAARYLEIPRSTYMRWLEVARARNLSAEEKPPGLFPVFPDDDIDAEQILDHMQSRFEKRQALVDAQKWFKINEPTDEPIAYSWFGDPHLGSNGCNIGLLRRDIQLIIDTPGMFAANIGDTVDNWGGTLTRLYADNDVSRQTERRLACWFLEEAEIPWRVWLEGNHDHMDMALTTYLRGINANRIPMLDWRARFRVCFPNGTEIRIDASHDHKGHSMWNPLHGQKRAASMDERADLYIAGHRHNAAIAQQEMPGGWIANMARARGYKYVDDYATRGNFHQQNYGASIVSVFDPTAENPTSRVQLFADVAAGAKYLTSLRL